MEIPTSLRRTARAASRRVSSIKGALRGNAVEAYWYTWKSNFGDLLTPALLRHYGLTPVSTRIGRAQLLAVGSILQAAPEDFTGHILGSGLVEDTRIRFERARIWAVRGELTRERIGAPPGIVLGDPGLLADRLVDTRQERRFAVGIVPHYVDKVDPRVASLQQRYPEAVTVIDVQRAPAAVLEEIDQCECILSSSLHGLVAADAFGIPSAWLLLSDRVIGGGFKFRDYFSSLGVSQEPVRLEGDDKLSLLIASARPPAPTVGELQGRVDEAFREFRRHVLR